LPPNRGVRAEVSSNPRGRPSRSCRSSCGSSCSASGWCSRGSGPSRSRHPRTGSRRARRHTAPLDGSPEAGLREGATDIEPARRLPPRLFVKACCQWRFESVRGRCARVQAAAAEYHARGSSDLVAMSPRLAGRARTIAGPRPARSLPRDPPISLAVSASDPAPTASSEPSRPLSSAGRCWIVSRPPCSTRDDGQPVAAYAVRGRDMGISGSEEESWRATK